MRLIDADKLIEEINSIGYVPVCADCCTKHEITEIIEEQTTAYDVQDVIDELIVENIHTSFDLDEHWDKCVEIIKAGGANE